MLFFSNTYCGYLSCLLICILEAPHIGAIGAWCAWVFCVRILQQQEMLFFFPQKEKKLEQTC